MMAPSALEGLFREAGHPLLMPYATAGYPDPDACLEIMSSYRNGGADIIELGIPFSDPLADGPVIQASSQHALRQGLRLDDVLSLAGRATADGARLVFLSYLNTILARGPERFFAQAACAGVLGVVVPDLPFEEAADLQEASRAAGVDLVLLAAPTSPQERLGRIAQAAAGFIYCVSSTGVTGARSSLGADLPAFLARLRSQTDLPLAVGFGVSSPQQAAEVARLADGVIIGSRLVALVQQAGSLREARTLIEEFLHSCREEMEGVLASGPGQ